MKKDRKPTRKFVTRKFKKTDNIPCEDLLQRKIITSCTLSVAPNGNAQIICADMGLNRQYLLD